MRGEREEGAEVEGVSVFPGEGISKRVGALVRTLRRPAPGGSGLPRETGVDVIFYRCYGIGENMCVGENRFAKLGCFYYGIYLLVCRMNEQINNKQVTR